LQRKSRSNRPGLPAYGTHAAADAPELQPVGGDGAGPAVIRDATQDGDG